jgi:signal transduction histidine kinase
MGSLVYIRLIGFTAGTLLQLFWMVVILGYRRQRNFERVFFFLCLALFFFYSGSLLALNAELYYPHIPPGLRSFVILLIGAGLCFLPALLVHLHLEFAFTRGLLSGVARKRAKLAVTYVPTLYFAFRTVPSFFRAGGFDFQIPGNSFGRLFGVWFVIAVLSCAIREVVFARRIEDRAQHRFHLLLAAILALSALAIFQLHVAPIEMPARMTELLATGLALLPILPLTVLIYLVQRHNFLQIGRQKNLLYAVSATFLALLYLSLVRRVSGWLEPVFPPEASASTLLFVLVIFIEPLQRALGKSLQETARREMDSVQRLAAAIQQEARLGDLRHLVHFIESRLKEQFEFADVGLVLLDPGTGKVQYQPAGRAFKEEFSILQAAKVAGTLCIEPHGAMISGETRAALELLCEQLPGALDLCRLIEEKLRLERELAERERLALLGQMAASISHNLKNPLGSIKTILQVQMENPELPESVRGENRIVLDEIGRLSSKLNQLLQFSRPAIRSGSATATSDARTVIEEVVGVLRHEAERRGIELQAKLPENGTRIAASPDAVSDILSNLLVNALESAPRGGHVSVSAAVKDSSCVLAVEDDGPGITAAAYEKILQPFFTTKAQGTGLGLAIVARRVAEFGGHLEWESPVRDGRGARFRVRLPLKSVGERGKE